MRAIFFCLATISLLASVALFCVFVAINLHYDVGTTDPCVEEALQFRLAYSNDYDRLIERRKLARTDAEIAAIDAEDEELRKKFSANTDAVFRKHGRPIPSLVPPDWSLRR